MIKRNFAFFILLALCFSLLSLGTFASETELSEVSVSVEIPKVGMGKAPVVCSSQEPEKYSVTAVVENWQEDYSLSEDATEFLSGTEYTARIRLIPAEGYTLSETVLVSVNGSTDSCNWLNDGTFEFKTFPAVLGTVDEVRVSDLPSVECGAEAKNYSKTETNYSVNGIWQIYDFSEKSLSPFSGVFREGEIYCLELTANTAPGYVFSPECAFYVDGEVDYRFYGSDLSGTALYYYGTGKEISYVKIDAESLPKAEIGKSYTGSSVEIPTSEDYDYTLSGYWYCSDGEESYVFEKGKRYYFRVEMAPKKGFYFGEDFELSVGDVETFCPADSAVYAGYDVRTSFADVVSEVTLSDLPQAAVGETLPLEPFPVTVPQDAHYSATATWYVTLQNGEYRSLAEYSQAATVREGLVYTLEVLVEPKEGYEFSVPVHVNAYGVPHRIEFGSEDGFLYTREYFFGEEISRIEISGIPEIVAGAVPSLDGISVSADAGYVIESCTLRDLSDATVANRPENGKDYWLSVSLIAKEGFVFSGEYTSVADGHLYDFSNPYKRTVLYEISLKETVTEIRVDGVASQTVGEKSRMDATVPSGANYTANVVWSVWNTGKKRWETFDGVFEADKIYSRSVLAVPADGYRFDENVRLILNGEEVSVSSVPIGVDYRTYYYGQKTVVDRIDLQVEKPVVGAHLGFRPNLTVVNGVGFSVIADSVDWFLPDIETNVYVRDGYVRDGVNYGARFVLVADDGYVFSDNLTVTVNGVTLPVEMVRNGRTEVSCLYGFAMKNPEQDPETEVTDTVDPDGSERDTQTNGDVSTVQTSGTEIAPQEDSDSGVLLWICVGVAVLLVGGGAVAFFVLRKKPSKETE